MAATPPRDAYDCAVIGEGLTARLIASALAEAGVATLLVERSEPQPLSAWLHPRLKQTAARELPSRQPLRSVVAHDSTGAPLSIFTIQEHGPAQPLISRANGESAAARITKLSREAFSARCVVQVEGSACPIGAAFGGIYRQVAFARGEECQALLYATRLPGWSCWLVPLADGLCSLGVMRTDHQPVLQEPPAAWLEEALVACPALAARLMNAELVGALHQTRSPARAEVCTANPRYIAVPEYETACDPLFASGHLLAKESAAELTDLLIAVSDDLSDFRAKVAAWQAARQEQELTVSRLIRSWYACQAPLPHEVLNRFLLPTTSPALTADPLRFSVELGNPTHPRRTISI